MVSRIGVIGSKSMSIYKKKENCILSCSKFGHVCKNVKYIFWVSIANNIKLDGKGKYISFQIHYIIINLRYKIYICILIQVNDSVIRLIFCQNKIFFTVYSKEDNDRPLVKW